MSAPLITVQGSILFPSSSHRKDYWGADCIFIMYIEVFSFFSSVAQSRLTLCGCVDCSTPDLPVHHQLQSLLKLMSIELMMPTNYLILCHPLLFLPTFNLSQHQCLFKCQLFASGGRSIGVSALTSVLAMNI